MFEEASLNLMFLPLAVIISRVVLVERISINIPVSAKSKTMESVGSMSWKKLIIHAGWLPGVTEQSYDMFSENVTGFVKLVWGDTTALMDSAPGTTSTCIIILSFDVYASLWLGTIPIMLLNGPCHN